MQELQDLLLDDVGAQVVGYLTGAGGGLAKSDLAELTGVPPYRLEPMLRGVRGRALEARAQRLSPATGPEQEEPAYLLGHEELRSLAVEQLGGDLERYRQGIHAWMQDYAAHGWPAGTPGYAARAYPLLLAAAGDVQRVSALARDPRRHAFLRTVTGDDSTALVEIAKARGLAAAQDVPDLHALVELAVYSDAMALRYKELPVDLPAIWAQLGHLGYAMALASSFPGPDERTGALVLTIAGAVAASPGDAGRLVGTLDEPDQRAAALGWGAAIAARAGDASGASRLAAQARTLAASADEQFRTQLLGYLEETAGSADGGAVPGQPPGEAGGADLDRAEAAARAVTEPEPLARRLAGVAVDAAAAGDRDRALRLAPEAVVLARALADSRPQSEVLAQAATATARAGQPDAAEALAREIITPRHQTAALSALAQLAVEAGDRTRAARLAADAQAAAQSAIDPDYRDQALVYLAAAVAEAGESGVAEDLAAAVTSPRHKAQALIELACRTGEPGLVARFVEEAFTIVFEVLDDETEQLTALQGLAFAAAETRVRVYGGTHRDLVEQSGDVVESALAEAAVLVARNGDPFYAVQLAELISGSDGYRVLTAVAVATAETLDPIVAKDIAARIDDDYYRSSALKQVAVAAIQNDSPDDAREIVGELPPKYRAVHSLPVVQEAADRGYLDIAEFVASTIPETTKYETKDKAEALAVTGHAAGAAGERDRAARLAKRAESLALGISDASTRSHALDRLVAEAARAGDPDRVIALTKVERPDSLAYLSERPVREALEAGQSDCAEALIRGMAGSGYLSNLKAQLLAEVAVHVARQRDLERAARLANEAEDLSGPDDVMGGFVAGNLAEVRARAGAADAAISLIRPFKWDTDRALAQAAVGAADAGHPDTAETLLECIADADERSRALPKVAVAAARAGSHHDAVRLARIAADTRSWDREDTLAEVAMETARTGNLEAAQSAAMAVSDPDKRDAVLTDVAVCAARRGDLAAARRIFAHAISGERGDFDPQQMVIFRLKTEKPFTKMARFFPAAILDSSGAFLRAYEGDRSPGSARTPTAADDTTGR